MSRQPVSTSRPSRTEPSTSEITQEFWDATKAQRLVLQWCKSCGNIVHYPREVCPFCLSEDLEFRPATGKGEVYAFTVIHRAQNPAMESKVPYVVALVNLEEGARLMTNVVNCPPDKVKVGMTVSVTWEELSDGRNLPLFEPASGGVRGG